MLFILNRNKSGLKEQIKIRSTISQALLLLKTQQYFQELTHQFQLQICVLLQKFLFFFFYTVWRIPTASTTMEQLNRDGSCTLNCGLWRKGLKERCWIGAAASLHLVFPHLVCVSGKTRFQWNSAQPEAGVTDTSPSPHTAAVAARNKGAAALRLSYNEAPKYRIKTAEWRLLWDL